MASIITLFILLIILSIDRKTIADNHNEPEPIGYGYSLKSVAIGPSGKSLTADLQLNRKSSVFGPDIDELHLFARYFQFLRISTCFLKLSVRLLQIQSSALFFSVSNTINTPVKSITYRVWMKDFSLFWGLHCTYGVLPAVNNLDI